MPQETGAIRARHSLSLVVPRCRFGGRKSCDCRRTLPNPLGHGKGNKAGEGQYAHRPSSIYYNELLRKNFVNVGDMGRTLPGQRLKDIDLRRPLGI